MSVTKPHFSALSLIKGVGMACFCPRRCWSTLVNQRPNDRVVCVSIILVLTSIRAGYPLLVHTKQLLAGPIPQEAVTLTRVVTEGVIDGLLFMVGIFFAAGLVCFLAPQFQGTASRDQALKLVTYSSMPVLLASGVGVLSAQSVFNISFWAWHLIVWGWCAVLLHEGTRVMTTIDHSKRFPFMTAFLASMLLLYVMLGALGIILKA